MGVGGGRWRLVGGGRGVKGILAKYNEGMGEKPYSHKGSMCCPKYQTEGKFCQGREGGCVL